MALGAALWTACGKPPARPGSFGAKGASGDSNSQGDAASLTSCKTAQPGESPLRRLTRFELNNTFRDIFGDDTQPANSIPSEELGNGFGNDAAAQSTSSLYVSQYKTMAAAVADRALANAAFVKQYASCLAAANSSATEDSCVNQVITALAPRLYRRPLTAAETGELTQLYKALRPSSTSFTAALSGLIATVLQSPDFLYRVEFGDGSTAKNNVVRLSGYEMASRLSYLFWGSVPDAALLKAAADNQLTTPAQIKAQAERLLADPKAKDVIHHFFDQYLPISDLASLERDKNLFPTFTPAIGKLMYQETHEFLDYLLFGEGSGNWGSAFNAGYTFVNEDLAKFYGIDGVKGDAFQKVAVDPSQRIGLLTQGGFLAGTTHSSVTSPVYRGSFVVQKLLCQTIPLPTGDIAAKAIAPTDTDGTTARERFTQHSADPVCASCHKRMDPIGLSFENYDPVGLYRTQENGKTIDASGALPAGIDNAGTAANAVELSKRIAASADTQKCFASKWMTYAYGKAITAKDSCSTSSLLQAYQDSGYNVRKMLIALTQTDAFMYRPAVTP